MHNTGEIELYAEKLNILSPTAKYPVTTVSPTTLEIKTDIPRVNDFTSRTHNCGELTIEHVGQKVTLCGWLEFQRMKKFIILRDGYGHTQIIVPQKVCNSFCFVSYLSCS